MIVLLATLLLVFSPPAQPDCLNEPPNDEVRLTCAVLADPLNDGAVVALFEWYVADGQPIAAMDTLNLLSPDGRREQFNTYSLFVTNQPLDTNGLRHLALMRVHGTLVFGDEPLSAPVEDLLAAAPDDPLGYYLRGVLAARENDVAAAEADFERVFGLTLEQPGYRTALGVAFADYINLQTAINLHIDATTLAPQNSAYYRDLAEAYLLVGNPGAALTAANNALSFAPDDPRNDLTVGRARAANDDLQGAAASFTTYVNAFRSEFRAPQRLELGAPGFTALTFNEVTVFEIDLIRGQAVNVQVKPFEDDTRADPLLIILDDEGFPLAANDNRTPASLESAVMGFIPPLTTTYQIWVTYPEAGYDFDVDVIVEEVEDV